MMNILLSTNDSYMMPTTVLMESILDTQTTPVVFYMMWSDLSEDSRNALQTLVDSRNSSIFFIRIDEDAFAGLPTREYISRETYFRLLASKYLPKDMERILWLDGDMIVRRELNSLYYMEFEDNAVIACPHGDVMRSIMDVNCKNIRIEHREQYFNAGMMLCNLNRWREMNIEDKIVSILDRKLKMSFPGQDLTNLIFNGFVKCEDYIKYNCMIHSIADNETLARAKEEAVIVHYAGRAKPWIFSDIYFADEFDAFYEKTSYHETKLKRMPYFLMKKYYEMREKEVTE